MPVLVGFLVYVAITVAFAVLHQLAIAGVMVFAGVVVLVIMLHEFGHFATAKGFGIKVEEFFVGFGPRLWSTRRGGTEYGIKAIPAGGYVRIAGMNPFQETPQEDLPRTFGAKPIWQRALVLGAGSFTHFVLAYVILIVFFSALGPLVAEPTVDVVVPRLSSGQPTPASHAGFEPGDRLVAVDGHPVTSWEDTQAYIRTHPGRPITFQLERHGASVTVTVTPASQDVGGERVGFIGIGPRVVRHRDDVIVALGHAFTGSADAPGLEDMVRGSFVALGRVFGPEGLRRIGQLLAGTRPREVNDVTGLVGAARLSGQAVQAGAFDALLLLFAGFNVFVGILNILPLPPLDGGHLAVLAIEKVTGKAVDIRRLVPLTAVVAGFLILFTISLLYLDIVSPLPNPFR